jgi:hypothetical protein
MSHVSVRDVVTVVRSIEHYKGKHIKELLSALEERKGGPVDAQERKLILDHFNGLTRAIYAKLGYSVEP